VKLYTMLEQAEAFGHSTIVRWQPHGRAFKIYDKKRFEKEILPLYFNSQTKFGSFQRQLNMYNFLRLARPSRDQKAYYHPQLLRGRPSLCSYIPRTRTANNTVRGTYDASTEPDFDKMAPVSWQDGLLTHMGLKEWGPLPIVNQAAEPIAEVTSHAYHQSLTSVITPVSACSNAFSGESNETAPLLYSGGITQFLSSRKRYASSSGLNSLVGTEIGSIPLDGLTTMPRVISRDLELTKKVPEASMRNAPWQGQPDHPVSTSNFTESVKTSLLDPDLADDVIYIFSERRNLSLEGECNTLPAEAQSPCDCLKTMWEPSTEADDVSLLTLSSDDWGDLDFGTCLEGNADSSDWLETIALESVWDADHWNV
jgi:HSF-type DNA-binding